MPKGSNYPGVVDATTIQKAQKASADVKKMLDFLPDVSPDLLTSASITPERLPLADKALEVALAAPDVMRRNFDPQRLTDNLACYRALAKLRDDLKTAGEKIKNAINALGADMMFDIGHIHADVEKDNGESVDLGPLRAELHDYYTHPGARTAPAPKKP